MRTVNVKNFLARLLFTLVLLSTGVAGAQVLDRMVAVVSPGRGGTHPILITLSDLELEARVALIERGASGAAEADLPDDTLAASLEWLIAEHLLLAEAEVLELDDLDTGALEAAIARFRSRFPTEEAWERFLRAQELVEGDLERIFRRRLVVDGYLSSRLRLAVTVSEAEIRQAWDRRESTFDPERYEQARPMLRAMLEKEKRESMVAALVGDVRRRAEVRILTRFGKRGTDG